MWTLLSHTVAFWKDIEPRAEDFCSSTAHCCVTMGNSLNLSELCFLIYKTLLRGVVVKPWSYEGSKDQTQLLGQFCLASTMF